MDLIQRANLTQVNNNERFIVFDTVFFLFFSIRWAWTRRHHVIESDFDAFYQYWYMVYRHLAA